MTEQQAEQPEPEPTTETEAEEQTGAPSRQERRDAHTRERLREVEEQRDRLQQRLDARDEADVQAMARRELGEAGAHLFRYELANLRDEEGNLDLDAVGEAIAPVRKALEEGRLQHHGDLGPRRSSKPSGPGWGELIRPRR